MVPPRPAFARQRAGLVLALIVLVALWIRLPGLDRPFDREFGGHQNAFFAIAAVNYAREGPWRHAGYPSVRIEGPAIVTDDVVPARDDDAASVYVNHPPTVPLLAYASARTLGPDGWGERWRDGLAPAGLEAPLRAPFLVLHVLGLLALWWAVHPAIGARAALLAVAFAGLAPVGVTYGPLVNYENAALPFVLVSFGAWIRHARDGSRRMLGLAALALALASSITWAPLAFAAAMLADALCRDRRLALRAALVLCPAAALPLAGHVLLSRTSGALRKNVLERVPEVLAPIRESPAVALDWTRSLATQATESIGLVALLLALAAALIAVRRGPTEGAGEPGRGRRFELAPLVLGAALYLLAFHRHTLEPQRMFLLALVPGIAALAAQAVDLVRGHGPRPRNALAAALILTVAAESSSQWRAIRHALHAPGVCDGPDGDPALGVPLPATAGAILARATPRGALVLVPRATGLHLAAGYYAWRNVVLVDSPRVLDSIRAAHPSSRVMPVYALLPEPLMSAAPAFASRFEGELPVGAARGAYVSGWRAWGLP
ncbi:MAG: hypothetical protein JNK02_06300 [Planctomycetes bacterium]|nr:hypothetical protein [Planctomycetota bacterium]